MTRVKICGITGPEDALRPADLGAWAIGMVFWPETPRLCPPDEAEAIAMAQLEAVRIVKQATRVL